MRVLDLFCGAGGFSCGHEAAGFEIVAGADMDRNALRTFAQNFPGAATLHVDLRTQTSIHRHTTGVRH